MKYFKFIAIAYGIFLNAYSSCLAQDADNPSVNDAQSFLMDVMAPNARMTILDNDYISDKLYFAKIQMKEEYPCIFSAFVTSNSNNRFILGFDFKNVEKIQFYQVGEDVEPFSASILVTGDVVYGSSKNPLTSHSVLLKFSTKGMRDRSLRALTFLQQNCRSESPF
ncbi:hypothetical protein [Novosphingobium sp.]|uniref:hypothetical protein n=1 Tax=Novosphingobium sp. TaxID=1874826 RepID=UPI003BAB01F0